MNLQDRKAFAVLSAFVRAVDRETLPTEGGLTHLRTNLVNAVEQGAADHAVALDEFLQDTAERASAAALTMAGAPPPPTLIETGERFRRNAGSVRCADCSPGGACTGRMSDAALVAASAGGHCIREIKAAFEAALASTKEVYARTPGGLPDMDVLLSTGGVTTPTGLIPGEALAANAATRFEDAATPVSHIRLKVAARHVDRRALNALPYLLLHEVFCHAWQKADFVGERPNKEDIDDPVSEGMMDALAVEILERAAEQSREGGDMEHAAEDAYDVGRSIHLARGSLDREPRFPEAPAVAQGVRALRLLRHVLQGEGIAPEVVSRLATELNVAAWSFGERRRGVAKLVKGLKGPRRDVELMTLLSDWIGGGDVGPLIRYLTET